MQIQLLGDRRDVADDLRAEHRTSQTTAVTEEGNALRLAGVELHVAQKADQTAVDTGGVHITAHGRHLGGGLDTLVEALLSQADEGLLDFFIGERLLVVDVAQLGRNVRKGRVGGVGQVVVVEHPRVGLGDQLAGGGVEDNMVKTVQRSLAVVVLDTVGAVLGLQGLLAGVVGLVAGIHSLGVALDGEVAVDDGVLARQVGLVEVVRVADVGSPQTRLEDDGSIGADEHGHAASTTGGTSSALGVQGNITADHNGVTTIPRRGLNPVDAVEDGVGATVASVHGVDSLNVGVTGRLEQLHQDRLDGLGLVEQSLRTNLQAANGLGVDVVLAEEGGEGGEGHGVDVCGGSACQFGNRLVLPR